MYNMYIYQLQNVKTDIQTKILEETAQTTATVLAIHVHM